MLRASLGAADCGKRLSIANEEGGQSQRNRPECATGSGLERTREGWMHKPTPGALYHILYSLSFFFKKYNIVIIQIYEKCKSPPRHAVTYYVTPLRPNLKQISTALKDWN